MYSNFCLIKSGLFAEKIVSLMFEFDNLQD